MDLAGLSEVASQHSGAFNILPHCITAIPPAFLVAGTFRVGLWPRTPVTTMTHRVRGVFNISAAPDSVPRKNSSEMKVK